MSYPCRMTDPFLPIYDFEELEAEPDPIPLDAWQANYITPEQLAAVLTPTPVVELLRRAGFVTFDPVNYGCIAIGTILNNSITTRPATELELAYDPYTLSYVVKDIK